MNVFDLVYALLLLAKGIDIHITTFDTKDGKVAYQVVGHFTGASDYHLLCTQTSRKGGWNMILLREPWNGEDFTSLLMDGNDQYVIEGWYAEVRWTTRALDWVKPFVAYPPAEDFYPGA